MTGPAPIISGLHEIAGAYDALVCDLWGVVHDGLRAHPRAVEALRRFRGDRGPIVFLTNAPRPPEGVAAQLDKMGVPRDCYDAIIASGGAAREALARRAARETVPLMHLGPERDMPLFAGLDVRLAGPEEASVVLCTGLYDDEKETPEDYRAMLLDLKNRGLPMICANPDIMVPRGDKLVPCAGAVAAAYEALGGGVAYYGKPHGEIGRMTLRAAGNPAHPLVVGDGLATDLRMANDMGVDALFVAEGLHARELGPLTPANLAALFGRWNVSARAAIAALTW